MILLRAVIRIDEEGRWFAEDARFPLMGEGASWYEAMKDLHLRVRRVRQSRQDRLSGS